MPKRFQFSARGRYYRRHRSLPIVTGTTPDGAATLSDPVRAMVTRWGYQGSEYRRPHDVYAVPGGPWCEIRNVPVHMGEDGRPDAWQHAYVPCADRTIRDRHASQTREAGDVPSVTIRVVGGVVVDVTGHGGDLDGVTLADSDSPRDYVDELLGVI